jgi:hypothetical protein
MSASGQVLQTGLTLGVYTALLGLLLPRKRKVAYNHISKSTPRRFGLHARLLSRLIPMRLVQDKAR